MVEIPIHHLALSALSPAMSWSSDDSVLTNLMMFPFPMKNVYSSIS